LDVYLEALDEELVTSHKPVSTLKAEEETESGDGDTEVGERDDTVREFFFCSLY
jgi:hypothetical protein